MRLAQIAEGFWHTYQHAEPVTTQEYTYYVDMDGVLADLEAAIKNARVTGSWRSPTVLAKAIGNVADPQAVYKFYMGVPKTAEADAVWAAATKAGGKAPIILTAAPINMANLADVKLDWCFQYLDPPPTDFHAVAPGRKAAFAKSKHDVLIDDTMGNIKGWEAAGGSGVLHQPGNIVSTQTGILNPGGEMGFELDLAKRQGVPTGLPMHGKGGGQAGYARYVVNNIARRMYIKTVKLADEAGGEPYELEIWGVQSVQDEITKNIIALFKRFLKSRSPNEPFDTNLNKLVQLYGKAVATFARAKYSEAGWPQVIMVPYSSGPITLQFAQAVAQAFGTGPPIVWQKNADPASVRVSPRGAMEFAQATGDNPEVVLRGWQRQAQRWARGEIETKSLNQYLRRGNITNVYVPPAQLDIQNKPVLIVDDITTFQMTMSDIGRQCLDAGAMIVFGTVMWLMG